MISALWNGISGLNTFQKAINVESNNATNVGTLGYKSDVVSFEDMMYQNRYGKGSNVQSVTKAMSEQGGIKFTNYTFDVAIEGKGYFMVRDIKSDGTAQNYYTRSGNFKMASDGFLKTQSDMNILGLSSVSTPPNSAFTDNYSRSIVSQSINNINFLETVNARSTDYTTSAQSDVLADTSGNNYKTKSAKLTDIDALIADYKSKLSVYSSNSSEAATPSTSQVSTVDYSNYLSDLINENDVINITIDGNVVKQQFDTDIQTTLKKFSDKISNIQGLTSSIDSSGKLTINSLIPGKEVKLDLAKINNNLVVPLNVVNAQLGTGRGAVDSSKAALELVLGRAGAQLLQIDSKIDLTGEKNLNVDKIQLNLTNLNLSNSIGNVVIEDGNIYVKDGENKFIVGKIETATFANEQGLVPEGGNIYSASKESGNAVYAGKLNKLVGSAVEESMSNLGNSLTALLIYQKAFEANSKSITTSDDLLKTAIELKK
ncbi:MAG: flagellar hook-basal body complex protein [Aliarcobacter sp.]|nr:flagellar hook-basal body complex protein [Aliarcobacter sp.]